MSLKQSYVNKIFEESTDLSLVIGETRMDRPWSAAPEGGMRCIGGFASGEGSSYMPHETHSEENATTEEEADGRPQRLFENLWDESTTFKRAIVERMSKFIGKRCLEIEALTGAVNPESKSYYAMLARHMLGIRTKDIKEFRDADIVMKTIRFNRKGISKESMSFPYFDYKEVVKQDWEDCEFREQLDRRFFFVVYQMTDAEDRDKHEAVFLGSFFWSMPYLDMIEAQHIWETAKKAICDGRYSELPRESQSHVAHVRPHGRDSGDTVEGPDGKKHVKKCFWLNRGYITEIAKKGLQPQ